MIRQKLLKLARIMTKFSLDDITSVLEIEDKEALKHIENLEKAGLLKKISDTDYLYTDVKNSKSSADCKIKPLIIDITKDEDYEMYLSAPEWAKRKANKYLAVIQASGGLNGSKLKFFVKQWNEKFPDMKTSYSAVQKARNDLFKKGISSLLAGYNTPNKGKSVVTDELYEYFKEFYLSFDAIPLTRAVKFAREKYLKLNPDKTEADLPAPLSFKRRLLREFTKEEIRQFRILRITGARLN